MTRIIDKMLQVDDKVTIGEAVGDVNRRCRRCARPNYLPEDEKERVAAYAEAVDLTDRAAVALQRDQMALAQGFLESAARKLGDCWETRRITLIIWSMHA